MRRGHLYVISAPSGTGKTTVVRRLRALCPALAHSVSYTTRASRPGEREGVDYYFVDTVTFQQMAAQGAFIEWARVHEHAYGTPKAQIEALLASGRDIMLDIDIQGARAVKRCDPTATLIFLAPPSMTVLAERLHQRGTESSAEIERRLRQAQHELAQQHHYDHVVINDQVERACAEIARVVSSARADATS